MVVVLKIKLEKGEKKEKLRKAIFTTFKFFNLKKIKNKVIFIKPNFNTADPFPASTDLNFLKQLVEILEKVNPEKIILADSSTILQNTDKVLKQKNVFELKRYSNKLEIYNLEKLGWIKKEVGGKYLKKVSISKLIDAIDYSIWVPCLKTHYLASYTGALKLAIGLIKPIERIGLHLNHLQEKIAELNLLFKPDLILMDARKCYIKGGPRKGLVRQPNLILASRDRVAIDIEGIKIIQSYQGNKLANIEPLNLLQIKRAIELGLGDTKCLVKTYLIR